MINSVPRGRQNPLGIAYITLRQCQKNVNEIKGRIGETENEEREGEMGVSKGDQERGHERVNVRRGDKREGGMVLEVWVQGRRGKGRTRRGKEIEE